MINPVMLYISAAALLLGIGTGWSVRDWKADADALRAVEAANAAQKAAISAIDKPAERFENTVTQLRPLEIETRNTIREVYRNVEVPADCVVPAAGIRLLDDARVNANAAAAGEPLAAVRGASEGSRAAD